MKWASSFRYLPINYSVELAQIENQTQRVVFYNNLCGERIRIRLSNKYSKQKLTLQKVLIGKIQNGLLKDQTSVTRNGEQIITLLPEEECWSDEIIFPARAGEHIAISIYIKDKQSIGSTSILWSRTGCIVTNSINGDFTNYNTFETIQADDIYSVVKEDVNKGMMFYGFTAVQVLTDDDVKVIAAFGDSITHMSYFTNALYKRLYEKYPSKVSLVNCGIGGNRVLHDATYVDFLPGQGSLFGDAGVKRFENDVFSYEKINSVLVLEGINDIMHPLQFSHLNEVITASDLQNGYKKYIEIARKHNASIYGATIMPCGHEICPPEWLIKFEEIRQDINSRIRNNSIGYDGYFDYDIAVRMPDKHEYMKNEYHIGDGLHPNDIGGKCMAEQVDLDLIMR